MSKMKEYLAKKDYFDGYYEGLREGVRMYAWWKDGVQYVGTCGRTLKEALEEINKRDYSVQHIGCEPRELI